MLAQLRIVDYAIIESLELELHPGLNVLTGETGAGKSIIVGATSLLRGGRGSAEVLRAGAELSVIEGFFDVSGDPDAERVLRDRGLPVAGGELLVRRTVPRSGRGRIHVNGGLCTVALLSELGSYLLDIAGQSEHQALTDRAVQRQILDRFAGLATELSDLARAHERVKEAAAALARLRLDEGQRGERIDFLRFQLGELDALRLSPGEDDELEARFARLQRAAELGDLATAGEGVLYSDDDAVTDRLAGLARRLEELGRVDPQLASLAAPLAEARLIVDDVAATLRAYGAGLELDGEALAGVEQRLDAIRRLRRKHGGTVAEILERAEQMRGELEGLEHIDAHLESAEGALAQAREEASRLADRVARKREKAGRRLAAEVSRHLGALCMEGARLVVSLAPRPPRQDDDPALVFGDRRLAATGWDQVELLISANPGEEPRPLARVASGGELSRVMLALRQVIGQYDPPGTSIYDEVDAGISGKTADVVGRCLADVARHRQVLCVTHLPQVAAHADRHFTVRKVRRQGRTVVRVEPLAGPRRVEELARMLGGRRVTAAARANAEQLLAAAARSR